MGPVFLIYIGGFVVGLFGTDDRPARRVALALLWPVGPLAFAVTVAVLVAAAVIAFPVFGVTAAAVGAAAWWVLR